MSFLEAIDGRHEPSAERHEPPHIRSGASARERTGSSTDLHARTCSVGPHHFPAAPPHPTMPSSGSDDFTPMGIEVSVVADGRGLLPRSPMASPTVRRHRFPMAACLLGVLVIALVLLVGKTVVSSTASPHGGPVIACVGDSITAGFQSSDPDRYSYPAVLSMALGDEYDVQNFGVSGTAAMPGADHPYTETDRYASALASRPEIVVIMLGTGDAKFVNWDSQQYVERHAAGAAAPAAAPTTTPRPACCCDLATVLLYSTNYYLVLPLTHLLAPRYVADYGAMIATFAALETKPTIWLGVPPPVYEIDEDAHAGHGINATVVNVVYPTLIREIAADHAAEVAGVVDVYEALGGADLERFEYFCDRQSCDTIHPNNMGYSALAAAVYKTVFAADLVRPRR